MLSRLARPSSILLLRRSTLAVAPPRRPLQSLSSREVGRDRTPDTNREKRFPPVDDSERHTDEPSGLHEDREIPLSDAGEELELDVKHKLRDTLSNAPGARADGRKWRSNPTTSSSADHPARLHTFASPLWRAPDSEATNESAIDDLKDDARRAKQRASNKMHQAANKAENVGLEVKEKAQEMAHGVKKAARHLKESINETVGGTAGASSTHPASSVFDEDDFDSASEPVRHAARSSQLSTTTGRSGSGSGTFSLWNTVPDSSTHSSSTSSSGSMGQSQESVSKGILDGPQQMPQGPGKRAFDDQGRPMETGKRGS